MGAPIGGLSAGVYNPNVAYRAANALRSQKCIITGFFNSNGLKDNFGVVSGLQYALVSNNIKQFGVMPYTIAEMNAQTNAYEITGASYMNRGWTGSGSTQIGSKNPNSTSAGGMAGSGAYRTPSTSYPGYWTNYKLGGGNTNGLAVAANFNSAYAPWVSVPGYDYHAGSGGPKTASRIQMYVQNIVTNSFDPNTKSYSVDAWYGRYSLSGGSFMPGGVIGYVPNGFYPSGGSVGSGYTQSVPANSGATSDTTMKLRRIDLAGSSTLTGGTANVYVGAGFGMGWDSARVGFTGDMFLGYMNLYETGATSGAIVAPFWAVGGQSVYDFAYSLHPSNPFPTHDNAIDHWIDVMSAPITCTAPSATAQNPFFIWLIADAVNQASETNASISGGYTSYSPEAYADNANYVISKILSRWTAKGLSSDNCLFWLYPDHPFPSDDPTFTTHATRISEYVTTGYDLVYARYPNNMFGSIPTQYKTPAQFFNPGLSSDTYYCLPDTSYTATAIQTCSGASAAAQGVPIIGTFPAGMTGGAYVRVISSNSTPIINGVHYVVAGLTNGIRVQIPGLISTGVTVAGTSATVGVVDAIHLGTPSKNTGLSANSLNGYNFYTPLPFADILTSTYADLIRSGAGGVTGVQTISSGTYRKVFLVSGNGTESFTITSGATSGTANTWSASNLEMKTLGWSVAHGGTASGHVSVLWENQGSGGTHSTIMNCMDSNLIQYSAMGLAFKNPCDNPTGNLLIRSNLGASGAYTVLVELGMPTSGLTTGLP